MPVGRPREGNGRRGVPEPGPAVFCRAGQTGHQQAPGAAEAKDHPRGCPAHRQTAMGSLVSIGPALAALESPKPVTLAAAHRLCRRRPAALLSLRG